MKNGKSSNIIKQATKSPQGQSNGNDFDVVCFSHLRWDFVFQRPQHLLTRCARERRVFFVEEPVWVNESMSLDVQHRGDGLTVVVPRLPEGLSSEVATTAVMKELMTRLFAEQGIENYLFWYYTPLALKFTQHLSPIASIYDCMDELSAFKGADSRLADYERELFKQVDLVFTGGQSLYEAKQNQHHSVYAFPSSIDRKHFAQARNGSLEPADQQLIPHPRLGFFGVIDERFDIALLDALARRKPDWQFVMIGPVVKIDSGSLPRHANIHYLGSKKYDELPAYLSGWDIALLLFARNDSTRFISPTKTPEYLAAGKPVISTSITDVIRPYGELGLVKIADHPDQFIEAAERYLSEPGNDQWMTRVDSYLSTMSWDQTWRQMSTLIEAAIKRRELKQQTRSMINPKPQSVSATV
jgi:UDP-galactopyranose mutase